jgi:hypothetical protein
MAGNSIAIYVAGYMQAGGIWSMQLPAIAERQRRKQAFPSHLMARRCREDRVDRREVSGVPPVSLTTKACASPRSRTGPPINIVALEAASSSSPPCP